MRAHEHMGIKSDLMRAPALPNYEKIGLHGRFDMRVLIDGRIVEHVNEPNLIVDGGRQLILKSIAGLGGPFLNALLIAVGIDGTPPELTNLGLAGTYSRPTIAVSLVGSVVNVRWVIDETQANGMPIREFGLFNSTDGTEVPDIVLLARKVRSGAIMKDASMRLEGTWSFGF